MKKLICALLALLVCLSLVTSLAEGVTFETKLQYMPALTAIKGTGYVVSTEKFDRTRSVYDTDGNLLAAFPYIGIAYLNYGFFTVWNEDDGKSLALANINGQLISEAAYGDFKMLSRHWALGYRLSPNEAGAYKRGKVGYDIVAYDLFYLDSEPVQTAPLASLSGADLVATGVHGNYIALQDGDGTIKLYDRQFNAYDFPGSKVTTTIFKVQDYTVFNYITNEVVAEGYTSVKEMNIDGETCLLVGQTDFEGKTVYSILDANGDVLVPAGYYITAAVGDYATVTDDEGLMGLFSFSKNELLVPCAFYNLPASSVSSDKYVHNGYVLVEDGGLRGYYDVVNQTVSVEPKLDAEKVTTIGCVSFVSTEEGVYTLYAADGTETEIYVDSINTTYSRGDGYLLVAVRNNMYGLIDWHGNEVLPFVHAKPIVITDDSRAIIRTSTGSQMDRIVK